MSRNDIANYLCLAVETVSRLFTQLQFIGIINLVRRTLRIRNRGALEVTGLSIGDAVTGAKTGQKNPEGPCNIEHMLHRFSGKDRI